MRDIVDVALQKCAQTVNVKLQVMDWLRATFGTVPETPWDEYPTYFTFKTANSGKWYALFMDVPAKVLGLSGEQTVSVVNVKAHPTAVETAVDNLHVFPAYHMNKKHWLTVLLDATTDRNYLQKLLHDSYDLSESKKKK